MGKIFDPDSDIMALLTAFGDLIIANVLWILTSMPIVTLGASTAALYSVVHSPSGNHFSSSVVRNYFHAFRRNFRQGTLLFLILLLPTALAAVNAVILVQGMLDGSLILYFICALPMAPLVFLWSYVFPLIAWYDNTVWGTLKNALLISLSNLPVSILIGLVNLAIPALYLWNPMLFLRGMVIWALAGFGLTAKISSLLLARVLKRYI